LFVEVDEEADRDVQELHVAEKLGFVDGKHLFDRFEFDQEAVFDEEVEAEWFFEGVALVLDEDGLLVDAGDFAEIEFAAQALFVDGFDEAWALVAVDFDGRADDFVGEFVGFDEKRMHGEVL
jgi:hypothetical protein